MKYFIAGKEIHSDKNYESGALQNYTELGFESVYSHLLAKRYIKSGKLNPKEDVVVTCEGREFLYNKHIKTISWKIYDEIAKKHTITTSINAADFIVDGVLLETPYFHENYMEGGKIYSEIYNSKFTEQENYQNYINNGTPKYKYFDEDYDIITNLNFNSNLTIPNKPYICFNRRVRKHREEFNMSKNYANKLIEKLIKDFDNDIFITGFHNENFDGMFNNRVHWVDLRDWCTLINNDKCFAAVQNQTGTTNLSQIAGKTKLLNIVINNDETMFTNPLYFNNRRPDVLGKAVNFKKLRNIVYRGAEPSIDDIAKNIKQYAES
jgi:hypothetical protein